MIGTICILTILYSLFIKRLPINVIKIYINVLHYRDAELYVDKLEKVLNEKSNYVQLLQMQLRRFQQFRKGNRRQSISVGLQ